MAKKSATTQKTSKKKEIRYVFEVVLHNKQRYQTAGDWIPSKPMRIVVSRLNNEDYEFLILFHELIEYELCKRHGITDKVVVAFDKNFEREREKGMHSISAEPGNSKKAPYRKEHIFATKMERLMAKQLGVDWKEYSKAVNNLYH